MKSRGAIMMLKGGFGLLAFCVLSILASYPILHLGQCSQGRFPMAAVNMDRPVICERLPNVIGAYFDFWATTWIFVAILWLPIFLLVWGVFVAFAEIAERRHLARLAQAQNSQE